ncbi:MAG: putative 2-dehydropantoate 2-reductase [Prolixibacteraceae bacterium]
MSLRYGVIGTGALGGFYGGKLANAGNDVHFLFRSDFRHVKQHGLRVDSVSGDFHLQKMNIYNATSEMPVCDVVLVCLKTTANHLLPDLINPLLHPRTVVVLIQNGLGLEEDLSGQMPGVAIAGGLAFICSNKIGPGHIQHLDFGKLVVGSFNVPENDILQKVVSDFKKTGVLSEFSDDLNRARWQKLVWNIPYNGLSVVLNTTTDRIMNNVHSRQLVKEMMLEVIRGANACGVSLNESLAQQMMSMTDKMKPYATSMKLDYDFRRPMEVEYIYSKPVEVAMLSGYRMHKIAMLEKQLRFIQENW